MILVTGSTGPFGNAAIKFLIEKGIAANQIAGFARNEKKAAELKERGMEIRMGSYDDYPSLVKAFKGIDRLLFVSGSELGKRDGQHKNIVRAAREASVNHIVYTSFERRDDITDIPVALISRTHIDTEKMIQESGIAYTFLRNALYAEGLPGFLGSDFIEKGISLPAGDGKVPFASRTDMAEAAAVVISDVSSHLNKSYRTVNIKNYSFYDIASFLSDITGKKVNYLDLPADEYRQRMLKAGIPAEAVGMMVLWGEGIRRGYFGSESSDLEKLIGRKPEDLKSILRKMY
jgi:NAD(P)H dehydrogenase (quinone)